MQSKVERMQQRNYNHIYQSSQQEYDIRVIMTIDKIIEC